jgi:peptide/nickel transport system permease protein
MSEQQTAPGAGPETLISEGAGYSKDYWDLVGEQLAKRQLFKGALWVLGVLYGLAIFAPLIGNDRPFKIVAIDYGAYSSALRSIGPVTRGLAGLLDETEESYASGRGATSGLDLGSALVIERQAVTTRLDTLRLYLPEASEGSLVAFEEHVDAGIAATLAGESAEAERQGVAALAEASAFGVELATGGPQQPEVGVQLESHTTWPLFESLSAGDVLFMVFWLLLFTWPFWNRLVNALLLGGKRQAIRDARAWKGGVLVCLPLGAALAWGVLVGGGGHAFDVGPYKQNLTRGSLIPTEAPLLAPIPIGYAETHTEESFRPPTWLASSQLDADGHFTRGLRRPKADPVTGFFPPPTPTEVRFGEPWPNAPSRHMAGTDELGRDFMVRMLWGGRVSLSIGILSAILLTVIGVVIGSLAGFLGGRFDMVVMRIIEIVQSIPAFFLILLTMAFTDPEVVPPMIAIVIVIAMIRWTGAARLVRGEFLRLREQEFVVAARALGFGTFRTVFRHVLPNAMGPVLVNAAFGVASGVLTESAISFLGFGVQHPDASWGSLIQESKSPEHWWITVFPGVLIFLTVTCYNLAGDAIRDAMDPKMKV